MSDLLFDYSVNLTGTEYKAINDVANMLVDGIIIREPDPLKRYVLTERLGEAMKLAVGERRIILGIQKSRAERGVKT